MKNSVRLYALSPTEMRAYMLSAIFAAGNVVLPLACHLVPHGGQVLLPIFFFTFVGAYKYGFTVGLTTAVVSPLLNSWLTGMPSAQMLPSLLVQSVLLAVLASVVARRWRSASFAILAFCVVAFQVLGLLLEEAMMPMATPFFQAFTTAIPGMLLMIIGGGWLIRKL